MTTKFRVTFADGRQATMLDMEERGLAYARESVAGRFGAHRIDKIEEMSSGAKRPDTKGGKRCP